MKTTTAKLGITLAGVLALAVTSVRAGALDERPPQSVRSGRSQYYGGETLEERARVDPVAAFRVEQLKIERDKLTETQRHNAENEAVARQQLKNDEARQAAEAKRKANEAVPREAGNGAKQVPFQNSAAVDMVEVGGVLKVPVQLNGAITLKFVVDSGASSVQIPKDVFLTLIRAETIKEGDFLPGATFILADGSKVKSDKFILRSIKVGESTFTDVEASVGGLEASLLLGQSFLKRFGEWKIDNNNGKLILTNPAKENHGRRGF